MDQSSRYRNNLYSQIEEAYGRVVYTYTTHLKTIDSLTKKNRRIKHLQIVLSAISTSGFVGSAITDETILTVIGGLFSTLLLALNLYVKDFNLSKEIAQHSNTANDLWSIRELYVSLLTDFDILTNENICKRRDELQLRTAEIYKAAPKTNPKCYTAAQHALKNGEEQFFSEGEIDQMLPKHLRRADKNHLDE